MRGQGVVSYLNAGFDRNKNLELRKEKTNEIKREPVECKTEREHTLKSDIAVVTPSLRLFNTSMSVL